MASPDTTVTIHCPVCGLDIESGVTYSLVAAADGEPGVAVNVAVDAEPFRLHLLNACHL